MTLHRSFLAVLLATSSSMHGFGQAPAPAAAPAAAGAPAPVAAATANASAPFVFKNSSFEEPIVEKRTLDTKGANPARIEATDWGHFVRRNGKGEGALNIGMTNEIARTGKQSIFFDFAGITGNRFTATLMTQLVPVKPQLPYKVGMWGRLDKERPLTLDQRRPYVRMEFEFYEEDEETQVRDTDYRVMRIPGSLKRLLFTSSQWNQAYGIVRVPAGAVLMKVSYVFEIPPKESGTTDGMIYFDDAFIEELPEDFPIETSDEIVVETDDEAEPAAAKKEDPLKAPVPIR